MATKKAKLAVKKTNVATVKADVLTAAKAASKPKQAPKPPLPDVDAHIREWRRIALSTTTDRAKAEHHINEAYKKAGYAPPKRIVWARSPNAALYIAAHEELGTKYPDPKTTDVIGMYNSITDWNAVYSARGNIIFGSNDAGWLARLDYVQKAGYSEALTPQAPDIIEFAKYAGWLLPYDEVAVVSERPIEIHLDAANRLHAPDRPAVLYSDRYASFVWHGVDVPKRYIAERKTLRPQDILAETNQELRRCAVEIYDDVHGKVGSFVLDSGADLVHEDSYGKLWSLPALQMLFVEVQDRQPKKDSGIRETYFLRVDWQCRPMKYGRDAIVTYGQPQPKTALNAVASTYGRTGEEYERFVKDAY